jgi:ABC-type transporter Mla maintaining outer membrane lipid asymmetry permease subunit MlaE
MAMVSFLEAPFKLLQNFVSWVGEIWQLLLESFKHLRRRRWLFALTLDQIATNGINSLPIVLLTVSAAGAVLALYTAHELASRGGERFVGWLVAYTVFREVCKGRFCLRR